MLLNAVIGVDRRVEVETAEWTNTTISSTSYDDDGTWYCGSDFKSLFVIDSSKFIKVLELLNTTVILVLLW